MAANQADKRTYSRYEAGRMITIGATLDKVLIQIALKPHSKKRKLENLAHLHERGIIKSEVLEYFSAKLQ